MVVRSKRHEPSRPLLPPLERHEEGRESMRVSRTGRRASLATIVALSLVLVHCGATSDPKDANTPARQAKLSSGLVETDEEPVRGGRIVYALPAESNGWNPT